ncbi:MAG TPA: FliH/SctL family protein [Pirellulales bacterium]
MPAVVKSNKAASLAPVSAWHGDDFARCAREEADAIIAAAHREAARLKAEAAEAGRREGRDRFEEELQAALDERLASLAPALEQTLGELATLRDEWLTLWRANVIELGQAIAERLLRGELSRRPDIPLRLIEESLQLAAGAPHVRVYLHPDDDRNLRETCLRMARRCAPTATVEWLADANVDRGSCRLETTQGVVDQQWSTQLARIAEELA